MAPIDIRGNTLDPASPGIIQLPTDASGTKYILVQLSREMNGKIASQLESHQAKIVKRMMENTWLLHYPPDDLRILETIDGVEHALVYVDDFVVHSDLQQYQTVGMLHV